MMTTKSLCILLLGLTTITPAFAQRFSKKEKERQEARANNYFYGNSFTVTAGYEHSWMTNGDVTSTTKTFGMSYRYRNTHDAFNIGFLWDRSFSRHWGMQHGLYYVKKGGEKTTFYDNGLGAGKLPYSSTEIAVGGVELQGMGRFFIPLTHRSRISVDGGWWLNKLINGGSNVGNWDMGVIAGLGYDYGHWSAGVHYQPGLYTKFTENSSARMNALMVNVGFRFWRK